MLTFGGAVHGVDLDTVAELARYGITVAEYVADAPISGTADNLEGV